VFLPHLELRRGDTCLYLRVGQVGETAAETLEPFVRKTPVALGCFLEDDPDRVLLQFPGLPPETVRAGEVLTAVSSHLEGAPAIPEQESGQPLPRAA
ncbi:MAG: hypothetical protein LC772_04190, partial [Chloroflexi bacterium]|nr:hypothetical protein [Chloroflexota bacterium]